MRLVFAQPKIAPIAVTSNAELIGAYQSSMQCLSRSVIVVKKYPTLQELVGSDNGEMSLADRQVFETIYDLADRDDAIMREVLSGAWTIVEDGGVFYRRVYLSGPEGFNDLGPYKRSSSHKSADPQYGIVLGPNLRTILLGTTPEGHSWFQLEGAPWGSRASFSESIEHAVDYVKYKFSGKNQGPFGASKHTDECPLKISFRPLLSVRMF